MVITWNYLILGSKVIARVIGYGTDSRQLCSDLNKYFLLGHSQNDVNQT